MKATITPNMAAMLRGEIGYQEDCKPLAELGRSFYMDGKTGVGYDFTPPPSGFPDRVVEAVERFTLACWELGRQDATNFT